jgi:hypothetical protein
MRLLVEVNDGKLAKKILTILSLFQDEGIEVKEVLSEVEMENSVLPESLIVERDRENLKLEDEENTEFLRFLHKLYGGKENISKLSDEEALVDALRDKYEL